MKWQRMETHIYTCRVHTDTHTLKGSDRERMRERRKQERERE